MQRSTKFRPPRRRWPGIVAAALFGAGIAALAVSSYYDERSLGERIDATVVAAERSVQGQVDGLKAGASAIADQGARASEKVFVSVADASITTAVKTALAADPSLSALKIDVTTRDGIVTLSGPAPDTKARERAAVLAAAPEGVRGVDNRLVVTPSS
ncbi:MAG TPA: BON domain-containing protein [Burkholderiaceae bacterium]|nr:BON domain-containing protein [Burkholderiaceae bacterium]